MTTVELLPAEIVSRHMNRAPVNLNAMAHELGLEVRRDQSLPDSISGKIECPEQGSCVVTINGLHGYRRQRFTLAHEIAHFILHRSRIGDGIIDDAKYRSVSLGDNDEREANRYAAAILMPNWLVREAFDSGLRTAKELADRFEVSEAVAEIRMRELRLA